ncbi:MAG: Lacal_2735 family protein [Gelidibacter sp.]
MSTPFYDVSKTKPSLVKTLGLNELEKKYKTFIEEAYNVMQTDASLSDFLYFEASKLKKRILNIKSADSNHFDAAF